MNIKRFIIFCVGSIVLFNTTAHRTTPEWIHNAVFYDIYPNSFMDSDGNGIGDLNGIISRLDYVKSLGVDAIWMNPIFESGWFDGGYDIIDFYKVDPRFGKSSDVTRLVEEAHKRGLKVCLDLVAGHSSNKSEWFRKAATEGSDGQYANYYIFSDQIPEEEMIHIQKRNELPNPEIGKRGKWVETFKVLDKNAGSLEKRANYYWKNFYPCQPALNYGYANPDPTKPWEQPVDAPGPKAVRRELKNIMAYWFDRGIDGFRVDMASSLVKKDEGHVETIKLWQEMRDWIDKEYPGKILISEWGIPKESLPSGFDVDFNMLKKRPGYAEIMWGEGHSKEVGNNAYFEKSGNGTIKNFIEEFKSDLDSTRYHGYIALMSSNHDVNRLNSEDRTMPDEIKTCFTFLLTMPGVPFIHYGDEIMMRNVRGLPNVEGSRELRSGTRTPMQWDNSESVGFSTAPHDKLYLPTYTDNGKLTVVAQNDDPNSVLNHVRKLNMLRHKYSTLANDGDWETISNTDNPYPWVYTRTGKDGKFIIVLNPRSKPSETLVDISGSGIENLLSNGKINTQFSKKGLKIKIGGMSSAVLRVK